jgi:hypothetical protein
MVLFLCLIFDTKVILYCDCWKCEQYVINFQFDVICFLISLVVNHDLSIEMESFILILYFNYDDKCMAINVTFICLVAIVCFVKYLSG